MRWAPAGGGLRPRRPGACIWRERSRAITQPGAAIRAVRAGRTPCPRSHVAAASSLSSGGARRHSLHLAAASGAQSGASRARELVVVARCSWRAALGQPPARTRPCVCACVRAPIRMCRRGQVLLVCVRAGLPVAVAPIRSCTHTDDAQRFRRAQLTNTTDGPHTPPMASSHCRTAAQFRCRFVSADYFVKFIMIFHTHHQTLTTVQTYTMACQVYQRHIDCESILSSWPQTDAKLSY